jgi:hypothetical protein
VGGATVINLPEGPAKVRLWYPRQLLEQATTPVMVSDTTHTVQIPTTIAQPRRRR